MNLEWKDKHYYLLEKIIKYGNAYAHAYNKQMDGNLGVVFSPAEAQILEYVLENEDHKISEHAKRLGITRSTFSKNIKKLIDKGLLEKFRCNSNQKDIFLKVTPYGKAIYEQYSKIIFEICFKDMFDVADQIPQEYAMKMAEILDIFAEKIINWGKGEEERIYTKIHGEETV